MCWSLSPEQRLACGCDRAMSRVAFYAVSACLLATLGGCAVVVVASTAVSITASVVGLAADAAVGTVKIVGKGVGAAADAVTGGSAPVP